MKNESTLVVVAYHSGYGHTARLAESVRTGAASVDGTKVELVSVDGITEQEWSLLDTADAIVFGSPTYMGSASPQFHTFARDSVQRWTEQAWTEQAWTEQAWTEQAWTEQAWTNKLAAGFTNSGSKSGDKLHTLEYMALLAAQHGMLWVSLGLVSGWNSSTSDENALNRLGVWLGAAAASNIDEGPELMHDSDLRTAEHLGRRVAEQARRLCQDPALPTGREARM
ncbi:flavodoxin family protein [Sphaerisporangium sp. NBC_01403]|uniref:flavodoxin family protein n=1 Tax=Sphaerisporangium sp. NBC_01403 TaxID=2903599 RepID=UPI0032492C81